MAGAIKNVYYRQMFTTSGVALHSEQYTVALNGVITTPRIISKFTIARFYCGVLHSNIPTMLFQAWSKACAPKAKLSCWYVCFSRMAFWSHSVLEPTTQEQLSGSTTVTLMT